MKKYLLRLSSIACAVLLLCHLSSCKDPAIVDKSNTLGFDPINLQHLDTDAVVFNTVLESPPLQTSGVSTGVLGSMNDAQVGKTFAGFYAQCLLSNSGAYFDSTPVVDSVVLYLPYLNDTSKYGKCQKPVDIIVYEVSQYMDPTLVYYNNNAFSVYGQAIGRLNNYVPDLIDSSIVRGYVLRPQISIKLSSAFAQKLLHTDSASLSSSTNFINYMKGIYVTTNTAKVGDGISYIDLQSCKISMFYHNSYEDTLQFDFPVTSYSATVNHFDHQFSGLVQTALSSPATGGDKVGYIQAGNATKLRLRIPNLLPSIKPIMPIAITKAELILPVDISDTIDYPLPQTVTFYRLDDTMGVQVLSSYNNAGVGTLSTRFDNSGNNPYYCYVFSLTEFLQRILNGYYNNNGFFVEYSYTVKADRAIILNNPANYSTQSKLKITYTKLQ